MVLILYVMALVVLLQAHLNLTLALHHIQSHQEIVMVMAMETLNILYHQDIMHLTQKI